MLHHLSFAVTDIERAAAFYDAALSALGNWAAALMRGRLLMQVLSFIHPPPIPRFQELLAALVRSLKTRVQPASSLYQEPIITVVVPRCSLVLLD